eukprot:scaffold9329_cov51-Attheya_sp.AAC.4
MVTPEKESVSGPASNEGLPGLVHNSSFALASVCETCGEGSCIVHTSTRLLGQSSKRRRTKSYEIVLDVPMFNKEPSSMLGTALKGAIIGALVALAGVGIVIAIQALLMHTERWKSLATDPGLVLLRPSSGISFLWAPLSWIARYKGGSALLSVTQPLVVASEWSRSKWRKVVTTNDILHPPQQDRALDDTSSSSSSTSNNDSVDDPSAPKLVVAGKMMVKGGQCNIAQLNLNTNEWSTEERIQLSLYNSYSGGEVYELLANHTVVDSEDDDNQFFQK